ncbi:TATA box-binding protein-associated factor RNA polymerase I subunit B [Liparis tanakae]|uniref:TATA box-binding protein-associated factor RNA polymerase I subunit B n=1 Tax=Liparis tanakae TaxID=230148 RepID=A0A4Z2F5V4_9TELE|nr:TATA box-binding protein-associated factor RNA polymerase I subunit B [Liparis tanakae]
MLICASATAIGVCGQKTAECKMLGAARFCWGGGASDGPSLHHQRLDGVLRGHAPSNASYWHPALRASQMCSRLFVEVEASLPRSFVWLLQLFCFLLDVKPAYLMEEVLRVETRFINKARRTRTRTRTKTRTKTMTKTKTKTRTRSGARRGRAAGETR